MNQLEILTQQIKDANGTDLLPAFNKFFSEIGKMEKEEVIALYHSISMFDQHTNMAVVKMTEQIKSALKQRMCALIAEQKAWIAEESGSPALYGDKVAKRKSKIESMKIQFQALTNDQVFSKF